MKQANQEKINFRVPRDFSETFNTSFRFLKQNFKSFFKVILYITGPFLLLSSIITTVYTTQFLDLEGFMQNGNNVENIISKVFSPMYFLTILSSILTYIILIGSVYEYMQIYDEKGPGNVQVQDVWEAIKRDFVILTGTFFGIFLISLLAGIIISMVLGLLFMASGALGGVVAVLFIIGFFIILFPVAYLFTSVYLIRIRERRGFIESLKRSAYSMKENFWWTWLIGLVSYLIIMVASLIFAIPAGIFSFIVAFNSASVNPMGDYSTIISILETASNFFSTLLYAVLMVIFGFHYLSLIESKEGSGMVEKIDEIGSGNNKLN